MVLDVGTEGITPTSSCHASAMHIHREPSKDRFQCVGLQCQSLRPNLHESGVRDEAEAEAKVDM